MSDWKISWEGFRFLLKVGPRKQAVFFFINPPLILEPQKKTLHHNYIETHQAEYMYRCVKLLSLHFKHEEKNPLTINTIKNQTALQLLTGRVNLTHRTHGHSGNHRANLLNNWSHTGTTLLVIILFTEQLQFHSYRKNGRVTSM